MTRQGGLPEEAPVVANLVERDATPPMQLDRWAKVPESLIVGRLPGMEPGDRRHAGCVLLYAHLDLVQGASGRPARNLTRIAEALGYQPRTVAGWADLLVTAGLIVVDQVGNEAATLRVAYNPARSQIDFPPMPPATRREPPKARTRAGHRGKRGENRVVPGARKTRDDNIDPSREKRETTARKTRDDTESLTRVQRAPVQVYEGVKMSEQCVSCGEPADGERGRRGHPYCKRCERF